MLIILLLCSTNFLYGGQEPVLSAGSFFSAVVGQNGELVTWGFNEYGQVGIEPSKPATTPIRIKLPQPAVSVACGDLHAVALLRDGYVYSWGRNNFGQLGRNDLKNDFTPAHLELGQIVFIASGTHHSLALAENGKVYGWGRNNAGQITSDPAIRQVSSPLEISSLPRDIVALACGAEHSLALTSDGFVWVWGKCGHISDSETGVPFKITGYPEIIQIASGDFHALALTVDGKVLSFGDNRKGQLGVYTVPDGPAVLNEVDNPDKVISIFAGSFSSMAVTEEGHLFVWGDNSDHQLGVDVSEFTSIPVKVPEVQNVALAAIGYKHSLVLQTDGQLLSSGRNERGQTGVGTRNTERFFAFVPTGLDLAQNLIWTGPVTGESRFVTGTTVTFSASAVSSWGRKLEYHFSGDDILEPSWAHSNAFNIRYNRPGEFKLNVMARSGIEVFLMTTHPEPFVFTVETAHGIPDLPAPIGETNIWVNSWQNYSLETDMTCSRGHSLEYQFVWSDAHKSDWSPESSAGFAWGKPGKYKVKVLARCIEDNEVFSDRSENLNVRIYSRDSFTPIYRLQSIGAEESTFGRIWTADAIESKHLDSLNSWRFEHIAWHAFIEPVPGSVPLVRYLSNERKIHVYESGTPTEERESDPDLTYEGIQFYVFAEPATDTLPIYLFHNKQLDLQYLTISEVERKDFEDNPETGYVFRGILGYAPNVEKLDERLSFESGEETQLSTEEIEAIAERSGFWSREFGWAGTFAVPGNYTGTAYDELAVYDSETGTWMILGDDFMTEWGGFPSGAPVYGDFDGDGVADLAVYSADSGNWYIQCSAAGYQVVEFGWSEAIPIPGDFDGDGVTDFGLYSHEDGMWYLWTSSGSYYELPLGSVESAAPVPGNYTGSGQTDLAIYNTDSFEWHIWSWQSGRVNVEFGEPDAVPVPADYTGDGVTDLAVFVPSTGLWKIWTFSGEFIELQFGWQGTVPVPADYNGDGKADLGVYDPIANHWFIWTW
ncbi:MAG: hypothetical protein GX811_05790 [Lentisphaerae bacterium]|nr:hypothetical protein [Lentisphaerota bacterium]